MRLLIHRNLMASMAALLHAASTFKFPLQAAELKARPTQKWLAAWRSRRSQAAQLHVLPCPAALQARAAQFLEDFHANRLGKADIDLLAALWQDPAVQMARAQSHLFQLPDNTA